MAGLEAGVRTLLQDLLSADAWRLDQDDAEGWCVSTAHPEVLFRVYVHVNRSDEDITIGTVEWHTHPDLLCGDRSDLTPLRAFLGDIFSGETEFVLEYVSGTLKDVWPCESREEELEYAPQGSDLRFVRWAAA